MSCWNLVKCGSGIQINPLNLRAAYRWRCEQIIESFHAHIIPLSHQCIMVINYFYVLAHQAMSLTPLVVMLFSPKFIKIANAAISEPNANLFNTSIKTSRFPTRCKEAEFSPVYKKGDALLRTTDL